MIDPMPFLTRWILCWLVAASLTACLPMGGGINTEATVNAVSTAVQQTAAAWTPTPGSLPPPGLTQWPATATNVPPPTALPITAAPPTVPPVAPTINIPTLAPPPTSPLPTVAPTAALARPAANGPVITAPRLSTPPTIDGDLRDWGTLNVLVNTITFRPENWQGTLDLSGIAALGWDANALYLALEVVDEVFAEPPVGAQMFLGDSAEVLFDANWAGDFASAQLSADDCQIGLAPNAPSAYRWFPANQAGLLSEVMVASTRTPSGYTLEAALPWSVLCGAAPQGGATFGLTLAISDNDNPATPAQQTLAASAPTRRLTDPTTWGTLILAP